MAEPVSSNAAAVATSDNNNSGGDNRFRKQKVEYLDKLGTDLTVVNAARVSYDTHKKEFTAFDEKLIEFLLKNSHLSPVRHASIQFRVTTDRATAAQFYKHVIGGNFSCPDHAWNELSQRYKKIENVVEIGTGNWRAQSANNKQCSNGLIGEQDEAQRIYEEHVRHGAETYNRLLELGVAREQARLTLPMGSMTKFIWTASLQCILHFIVLRDSDDSQFEIRELAQQIAAHVKEHFPVVYASFERHREKF